MTFAFTTMSANCLLVIVIIFVKFVIILLYNPHQKVKNITTVIIMIRARETFLVRFEIRG